MHESNTYEFTVAQKKEGKAKLTPILLVAAYVVFFIACLVVFGLINMPMLFVIPVIVGVPAMSFAWILTKIDAVQPSFTLVSISGYGSGHEQTLFFSQKIPAQVQNSRQTANIPMDTLVMSTYPVLRWRR